MTDVKPNSVGWCVKCEYHFGEPSAAKGSTCECGAVLVPRKGYLCPACDFLHDSLGAVQDCGHEGAS